MTDCDVLVVGSGVAGALVSWSLARVGAAVIILEAGEQPGTRSQLLDAYAAASPKTPGSPFKSFESPLAPSPDGVDDYYVQPDVEKFQSTYERIVGGSTWHMLGHAPRLIPSDFKLRSEYGIAVDWPITYADLEPWYALAETALGVAGDYESWNGVMGGWRSTVFPMPAIAKSYSDQRVANAIEGEAILERPVAVLPTPASRNSEAYDDRPACRGNGSCVPLCPIQAKYDATVHVRKAIKSGARLQARSVVTNLLVGTDGKISSARYRTWDGVERTISAKVVVLAANAIESAKILLLSGLGNESDQVGRNLMDHVQKSSFGMCDEPLFPFRGPPSTSGIEVFRDGPERARRGAFRISLDNDGWYRRNSPAADVQLLINEESLFGDDLVNRLRAATRAQLRLSCSTEVLPEGHNRVTLSTERDALGIPRPQISFRASDYAKRALVAANEAMRQIFAAMGDANPIIDMNANRYSGAGHIIGTCRMGTSASSSVVDPECRTHAFDNLFVIGSSVFPTAGTANPTLTIAALALRCAVSASNAL